MNKTSNKLQESLMENDLKWLVEDTVMIDKHKTKLGDDAKYLVLAIVVTDKQPAEDLATFIENSVYEFEDVEVSQATDQDGNYQIYVELKRGPDAYNTIKGLLTDASKLSGIEDWKFQGMDMNESVPFEEDMFNRFIITDPHEYARLHPNQEQQDKDTSSQAGDEITEPVNPVHEEIRSRLKFLMNY
jgi:hypothetical protein